MLWLHYVGLSIPIPTKISGLANPDQSTNHLFCNARNDHCYSYQPIGFPPGPYITSPARNASFAQWSWSALGAPGSQVTPPLSNF